MQMAFILHPTRPVKFLSMTGILELDDPQPGDSRPEPGPPSSSQDIELVGAQTNVATREDVPPDGGYGWVCTVCMFLINANTWGVNSVCVESWYYN